MKDDQRVALTKRLLKEGLLRLLKTTELDQISVTELCKEAGINRATFYRHYDQPRDILNELRYDLFQNVKSIAGQKHSEDGLQSWLEESCRYFYDHAEVLNIFFKYRTDDEFVMFLNDMYKEQFPEVRSKGLFRELDDDTMRLGGYYLAGGIYYILRQWLSEPINKTPEEIAQLICQLLNFSGQEE